MTDDSAKLTLGTSDTNIPGVLVPAVVHEAESKSGMESNGAEIGLQAKRVVESPFLLDKFAAVDVHAHKDSQEGQRQEISHHEPIATGDGVDVVGLWPRQDHFHWWELHDGDFWKSRLDF